MDPDATPAQREPARTRETRPPDRAPALGLDAAAA